MFDSWHPVMGASGVRFAAIRSYKQISLFTVLNSHHNFPVTRIEAEDEM